MSKPPFIIERDGYKYRRMGRPGRPIKEPRINNGKQEWFCPCCEEWFESYLFGKDAGAANGLTSWCKRCRREYARMGRALRGTGEPEGVD